MAKCESKQFMPPPANRDRADHIAILVHSLSGGGEQRTTISLAEAFASAGRRVDIYVPGHRGGAGSEMPPNVTVHLISTDAAAARKRRFSSRNDAYARVLADELIRNPPDLLLSAGSASAIAAGVKAWLPQLPLVIRAASHPRRPIPWRRIRHRLLEPARRLLRSRRYRAADLIISVGEDVAAAVKVMAPDVPILVLPGPVITRQFLEDLASAAPEHPWLAEKVPIALAVGRLAVPKDLSTLLRAFALVRSRRELRLVILGDGLDRFRLADLARRLGIERDVDFAGWSDQVAAWLARASVFVSTSIWEGSPGAIIEALAAGCPIVATDCPGDTRQLLSNGRLGGLAPIGDAAKIAELIEKQLDSPGDPEALRAAAAPFEEESAAAAHLEALDSFVRCALRPGAIRG